MEVEEEVEEEQDIFVKLQEIGLNFGGLLNWWRSYYRNGFIRKIQNILVR